MERYLVKLIHPVSDDYAYKNKYFTAKKSRQVDTDCLLVKIEQKEIYYHMKRLEIYLYNKLALALKRKEIL